MHRLIDSFGRDFHYLRLSVTDVCNFRCVYCLPNGYQKPERAEEPLTVDEIRNLVAGFAELGLWKVRLTGGEPTVRRDFLELAAAVAATPGIRKVALTTNGYRLKQLASELRHAGITSLNVSVDSLDPGRFREITGTDRLDEVLDGIGAALKAGFETVKVNAVLLRDLNDADLEAFLKWTVDVPVSIRFIELMRTGENEELFRRRHLSGGEVKLRLLRQGWSLRERAPGDGPAVEFEHPEHRGRIGIIAPYSQDFCRSCNRLRVSSTGGLRLCLFGEKDHALRPLLQHESQREELIASVRGLMDRKAVSHYLHEGIYGNTGNLAAIGG